MRKVIVIALGLLIALSLVTTSFADTGSVAQVVYSVTLRNNTETHADYIIPTTTIRPDTDKLWGYDCVSIAGSGNPETWISMFDSTTSIMTGEVFGEQEAGGKESIKDRWFAGKWIFNGVAARIGAFTEATIYFIRR